MIIQITPYFGTKLLGYGHFSKAKGKENQKVEKNSNGR
jgi:hypothetical protein